MIDVTCAILSMNVHFDKKNDNSVYCVKFRPIVTPVILHCIANFECSVIRTLPGMNEKTQSYIFTSGSRRLHAPRPLEINMEIDVLFSYCYERPSDLTMICKVLNVSFECGIDISH